MQERRSAGGLDGYAPDRDNRCVRVVASLAVVLGTIAFAASAASADVPAGFVSHPELAQRVQFIVDHPINVYCATSDDAWTAWRASIGRSADAAGYAPYAGTEAYLNLSPCRDLLKKVTGQPFSRAALTAGLLTLAHEAEHLAGHRDEHETDCAALAGIRQVAMNFGFRKRANVERIAGDASTIHSLLPVPYAGPC